jgi:hypothetical protein
METSKIRIPSANPSDKKTPKNQSDPGTRTPNFVAASPALGTLKVLWRHCRLRHITPEKRAAGTLS